jgi:hypothetical protein
MLQVLAGAMLFVPGVGPALGGAISRIGAAANEMDMFKSLDWATVPIEQRGTTVARIAHPFDKTANSFMRPSDTLPVATSGIPDRGAALPR